VALRHELPTHLGVEDHVFGGLSIGQLLILVCGCALGASIWLQWTGLTPGLRAALAVLTLLLAIVLALFRPVGRSVVGWGLIIGRYACGPRSSVWRPRTPDATEWRRPHGTWTGHAPRISWTKDHEDPSEAPS